MSNPTLVAYVRPSQCIIASNHHNANLCFLELANRSLSLRLQLVFKHLESVENESSLRILTSDVFVVISLNAFAANRKHSEAVGSVLFEHFVVVGGN